MKISVKGRIRNNSLIPVYMIYEPTLDMCTKLNLLGSTLPQKSVTEINLKIVEREIIEK